MTRFAGLIVAAIVMIAGGLGAVAFGAFMIFEFIHQPSLSSGVSTVAVNALLNFMMVVMLLVPTAGGVWSILTGGGLLRQLKWARTSALVIAAITLTISVPVFLLMLVVPIVSMRKSGGIDALVMLRAATIAALPVAISVWALWYLNNAEVKKQFGIVRTGAFAPIPLPATRKISARPTAVSLIAWYLIVSGGLLVSSVPMYLLLRSPWIFFGFILHAWSAIGVSLVWAGASVAAGIALLKAKESGGVFGDWRVFNFAPQHFHNAATPRISECHAAVPGRNVQVVGNVAISTADSHCAYGVVRILAGFADSDHVDCVSGEAERAWTSEG